jgi:hypothetical protein
MALTGHEPGRGNHTAQYSPELQEKLSTLFALAALPVAPLFLFAPRDVLLPAVSVLSLVLAFVVATYAWHYGARYRSPHLTFWDLAGAFALIGFGAGALSDSHAAIQFFGMTATR